MNRLHHLQQTLPVNIAENSAHPNLEFVVLNYNSKDGMDDWIKTHMSHYIESGLVKYYKTEEPEYFSLAHSKNMVTKLATGDIICNVDADNYAGLDYVLWVEECFAATGPNTIITTIRKDSIPYRDQGGKLCFSRDLFLAVNGYDESLIGYGMDDVDLSNRMENAGGRRVFIEQDKYLRCIEHGFDERLSNYKYPNNLESLYLCVPETTDNKAKILYLFKDNTVAEMSYDFDASLRNNLVITYVGWTVGKDGCREANFRRVNEHLLLTFLDQPAVAYREETTGDLRVADTGYIYWKKITKGDRMYFEAVMGYNECLNRRTFVKNDISKAPVNTNGWGKGTVYLNFDRANSYLVN
jgi:hypothetical protein